EWRLGPCPDWSAQGDGGEAPEDGQRPGRAVFVAADEGWVAACPGRSAEVGDGLGYALSACRGCGEAVRVRSIVGDVLRPGYGAAGRAEELSAEGRHRIDDREGLG